MIKSWRKKRAGHVKRTGGKCMKSFHRKIWEKETTWKMRHRSEDNIEMDLK
jgi:hypothetical protein